MSPPRKVSPTETRTLAHPCAFRVEASLLSGMPVPEGYTGPTLKILSRNLKQEEVPAFVKRVLAEVPADVKKVAVFLKDRPDGDLYQKVFEGFGERGATMLEMGDFFQEV